MTKLDLTTGAADSAFGAGGTVSLDQSVSVLGSIAGALYVGGDFTAVGGVAGSATRLVKLDPATGALDTTFTPPALGTAASTRSR